ncbi:hypothetical protein AcV7_000373 [Taiwanofungus camphoratus]|nr:hypothetical protein AcV7_000373 [Antrodia cinnamomea]
MAPGSWHFGSILLVKGEGTKANRDRLIYNGISSKKRIGTVAFVLLESVGSDVSSRARGLCHVGLLLHR